MMVSNLDYDSHKGKIAIGRIFRGKVAPQRPRRVLLLPTGASSRSKSPKC